MTDKMQKKETEAMMERPDFIGTGDSRGTDHITKDDIQMPRLAVGQGLTPQVVEGKEGFSVGVLFNSVTEERFGRGPIHFTVIRADAPRYVEFIPREEGGGIRDMNVQPVLPDGRPNPKVHFGPNGEKPEATKFYDFIIAMLPLNPVNPMDNLIALSLKSTGLKAAKRLNSLMRMRNAPSFAGRYVLTSEIDKNSKGTFAVYKIDNAGWVDKPTYEACEELFNIFKDKDVAIDRDAGGHDEAVDDSMAANPEDASGM